MEHCQIVDSMSQKVSIPEGLSEMNLKEPGKSQRNLELVWRMIEESETCLQESENLEDS